MIVHIITKIKHTLWDTNSTIQENADRIGIKYDSMCKFKFRHRLKCKKADHRIKPLWKHGNSSGYNSSVV